MAIAAQQDLRNLSVHGCVDGLPALQKAKTAPGHGSFALVERHPFRRAAPLPGVVFAESRVSCSSSEYSLVADSAVADG